MLNTKHVMAITIPMLARTYEMPVNHGLKVRMIFIGVPSGGGPPT